MLIDETTDTSANHYQLTQTHHLDGHTVRVRVHRDFYPHQSWAAADVLSPALTWTELATAPASDWHPTTRTVRTAAADGPGLPAAHRRPPRRASPTAAVHHRPPEHPRSRMRHPGRAGTEPHPPAERPAQQPLHSTRHRPQPLAAADLATPTT